MPFEVITKSVSVNVTFGFSAKAYATFVPSFAHTTRLSIGSSATAIILIKGSNISKIIFFIDIIDIEKACNHSFCLPSYLVTAK